MVSEKTVLIEGTTIWVALAERSKVNLDLWNLFIAIVTLYENNDFGFNNFKKSTFQIFPHLNALGSKFDLEVK